MAAVNANNGAFKKGHDPRRWKSDNKGLMEYHTNLTAMLAEKSYKAVEYMYSVLDDNKASPALRLRVAEQILDRVHGKPVDRSVVATVDAGSDGKAADKLDDAKLLQLIQLIDEKNQAIESDSQVIDIE